MRFFKYLLKNPKVGLIFTTILLVFFVSVLLNSYFVKGEIVSRGIDFTGGTQAIVEVSAAPTQEKMDALTAAATKISSETRVRFVQATPPYISIESDKELTNNQITELLNSEMVSFTNVNVRVIGAALSSAFLSQAVWAIIFAFIAMSIVVFFAFKIFVPSLAVILCGICDMTAALALMNIFDVKLSLASLAALLMIIGYSVDTDILLTTRLLKRKEGGTVEERIASSAKTGLTMTTAAIVAMVILLLLTSATVLFQIATVIMFGLFADMPFTWLQNVGILQLYIHRQEKKKAKKEAK